MARSIGLRRSANRTPQAACSAPRGMDHRPSVAGSQTVPRMPRKGRAHPGGGRQMARPVPATGSHRQPLGQSPSRHRRLHRPLPPSQMAVAQSAARPQGCPKPRVPAGTQPMTMVLPATCGMQPKPGGHPPAGWHAWVQTAPSTVSSSHTAERQRLLPLAVAPHDRPIARSPITMSGGTHTSPGAPDSGAQA